MLSLAAVYAVCRARGLDWAVGGAPDLETGTVASGARRVRVVVDAWVMGADMEENEPGLGNKGGLGAK